MKTVKTLKLITSCLLLSASMCFVAPLRAAPAPKPPPTAQENLPFGIPVPKHPFLVYSPYAKGKIMDVEGFKHGEVVICPYSARKFRVP
jgi:hypothetical protein